MSGVACHSPTRPRLGLPRTGRHSPSHHGPRGGPPRRSGPPQARRAVPGWLRRWGLPAKWKRRRIAARPGSPEPLNPPAGRGGVAGERRPSSSPRRDGDRRSFNRLEHRGFRPPLPALRSETPCKGSRPTVRLARPGLRRASPAGRAIVHARRSPRWLAPPGSTRPESPARPAGDRSPRTCSFSSPPAKARGCIEGPPGGRRGAPTGHTSSATSSTTWCSTRATGGRSSPPRRPATWVPRYSARPTSAAPGRRRRGRPPLQRHLPERRAGSSITRSGSLPVTRPTRACGTRGRRRTGSFALPTGESPGTPFPASTTTHNTERGWGPSKTVRRTALSCTPSSCIRSSPPTSTWACRAAACTNRWTPAGAGHPSCKGSRWSRGSNPANLALHDPHCVRLCPSDPERLYQQNHCGIYRLDRPSKEWVRIGKNMPKAIGDIGFPMVVHPRDADTAWVFPMDGTTVWPRTSPGGRPAAYVTRDGGATWRRLDSGLPRKHAWWTVKRQAMTADRRDPVGLYLGTTSGELWMSSDEGRRWSCLARHLPEIYAVEAAEARP